jgi:hypothetical protein
MYSCYKLRKMHASCGTWGINPILNQYDCPQMNIRIGIDLGENAVIQRGWDIHPNLINVEDNGINNSINTGDQPLVKKPVYDILGYNTNLAVKMTALANPNHMVIGVDPIDHPYDMVELVLFMVELVLFKVE